MSEIIRRREFLSNAWKWGLGLIGAAGAWTTWDLLQPTDTGGFGGLVRTISPDAVPDTGVVEVPAARAYLVRIGGELLALSEKCTHLGCRVPFCASSGEFECPCHGSVFNRAGEYRAGPAPRGLDRYPVEIGEDGLVYIDTADKVNGPPPGPESIDEPVSGPKCTETEGEA
jgi:cytochrome b6-f complex iron-sulfur subunit